MRGQGPSPQELLRDLDALIRQLLQLRYRRPIEKVNVGVVFVDKTERHPCTMDEYAAIYELAFGLQASASNGEKVKGSGWSDPTFSLAFDRRKKAARGTCKHVGNLVDGMFEKLRKLEEAVELTFTPTEKDATTSGPLEPVEEPTPQERLALLTAQRRRHGRGEL